MSSKSKTETQDEKKVKLNKIETITVIIAAVGPAAYHILSKLRPDIVDEYSDKLKAVATELLDVLEEVDIPAWLREKLIELSTLKKGHDHSSTA